MKLISAIEFVLLLAKGHEVTYKDRAAYFCSIKESGKEYTVYISQYPE